MKKESYIKRLSFMIFILSIMLGSVPALQAQNITVYQYRQVPPDKVNEFIKRETTYWSQVAKKAIDSGKMNLWALLEKVGGTDMKNSSNFIFVNVFPNIDTDLSDVFNPTTLFPGVPMDQMSTYDISTVMDEIYAHADGWEQAANAVPSQDFNYVMINYHNTSDPAQFNEIEKNNWGPFIKAAMDNNQVDQKAWGNSIILSPTGGKMKFNCFSSDFYTNLKSALMPTWSPDVKLPTIALDSLQKLSLSVPNRVIYRILKVESKNQ
jgi:hypothetical protein